jgi:flagellar hook assembly protein FlgD
VAGSGVSGASVTDVLPPDETFQAFLASPSGTAPVSTQLVLSSGVTTTQLVWTLPTPLAAGSYQITYQAKVNDFIKGGTSLDNCALLAYPGLGLPASSCVTVPVIGEFTVTIGVYNEAGELVKTILIAKYSQPIENVSLQGNNVITKLQGPGSTIGIYYQGNLIGTWDGSTTTGDPATNGSYYIKIDNVDNFGVDRSTTVQAMVSRSLFKTTVLVYNEAGEVIRHLYAYSDDPGKTTVTGAQLSTNFIEPSDNGSAGTGVPSQVTVSLNNGTTVVWDGKSDTGTVVQSGQYFMEIHTVDGSGGETVVTQRVSVLDAKAHVGMGSIVAGPNILNAANAWTTLITDSSAPGLTLKVGLYTTAGELAGVIPGGAGTNQVSWNAQGLASGLYFASVESRNAAGAVVNHRVLKIIVVR